MRIGFDALAVQNGCRGAAAPARANAQKHAQCAVEGMPGLVEGPFAENVIDRLPRRETGRKHAPLDAALDHVENRVDHLPPVRWGTSSPRRFRQHPFQIVPLRIGKITLVFGDFHRQTELRLKVGKEPRRGQLQVLSQYSIASGHYLEFSDRL